ncbi:MAG: hypothetical protein AB7O66_22985 [Limisphaerales bacterium]
MISRSRRRLPWILLLIVFSVGLLVYVGRVPPLPTRAPAPSPNGYHDLTAAVALLKDLPAPGGKATPAEIAAFVSANPAVLDRVRLGLSRESQVPPYDPTRAQAHMDEIGGFKALARLFAGVAEDALERKDWNRLVTSSTQGIDLGLRVAQGGVLIDQMVATAAEAVARTPLSKALARIPAEPAKKAARTLMELDATREPYLRVRLQEEDVVRHSPWTTRIAWKLFLRRRTQPALVRTEKGVNENTLATRTLALELAARAHSLEKGSPPASASALVPEYLPSVPTHPVTGQPLALPRPGDPGAP